MKLTTIYSFLRKDLAVIEQELEKTIAADHPTLQEASHQLLKAGGKRIRPVFVILSSHFGSYNLDEVKKVAVALELIHMASLVHDDVIDDAPLRRGKKTVKAQWDNRIAMYTGDYIFARALELITYLEKPSAHEVLSKAIVEMCIGEIKQIEDQYDVDQNFRQYLRRIKRKTALLISNSCEMGAIASGASDDYQRLLRKFGYYVGMSFQITDDILDFTGTEKDLGKPAGGDLEQGNITLPALYAMRTPFIKEAVKDLYNKEDLDKKRLHETLQLIRKSGAIEFSQEISNQYLRKAYEALDELPEIRAREHLKQIAEYIGNRNY